MKKLTMKFGGTSLGDAQAISRAADICTREQTSWGWLLVIASAMSGITDLLLESTQAAIQNYAVIRSIRTEIFRRHAEVGEQLIQSPDRRSVLLSDLAAVLDVFERSCEEISQRGEAEAALLDIVASIGERCSARLLAAVLQERDLPSMALEASQLIVTDNRFQNAAPNMQLTEKRVRGNLLPILERGIIPVVTGFMGATFDGEITTLGRGGSDFSASILGACIETDELWIWTDVDGVLTADPAIVANAQVIEKLSYKEVSELAYFGAKVLHPKTIQPLVERGTRIWVRNTFEADRPGTCIGPRPNGKTGSIKAVTAIRELSMVTVEGRGMIGVPGVAARTFAAVASAGVSVLMISQASSEQSISFVVPNETAKRVIAAIEEEMQRELARRDIDSVWSIDEAVVVTAVGAGLRDTPGVAARIFGSLGRANINVYAIAQGSSECGLSLVVASENAQAAVQTIHDAVVMDA
ncbi:MAG: aspartate kinase [Anaerolineales bacterium]|nr:aspartate kinase [Anaerolineales bacterium]